MARPRKLLAALAAHGRHPGALVLGCIDSRVDPSMIVGAGAGEILVGNAPWPSLVPPYAPDRADHGISAVLEFGLAYTVSLTSSHLVMACAAGSARCSVLCLRTRGTSSPAGSRWPARARRAPLRRSGRAGDQAVARQYGAFPWIAGRVARTELALHGARFAIHTGAPAMSQPDGGFHPA